MSAAAPIFLISGLPGAGKSTVARTLARRFARGFYLSVDALRAWVISGYAIATPVLSDEAALQFTVARRAAAQIAREYADAGFTVAVDDLLFPDEARDRFVAPLAGYAVQKVLLRPSRAMTLQRNAEREAKAPEVTARLAEIIHALDQHMDSEAYAADGWFVLDTTTLTVDATIDAILRRWPTSS
jgi:chloramphenicol 3-O-phosphotransferase